MDKTTLFSIALLIAAALLEFSIREIPAAPAAENTPPAENQMTLESFPVSSEKPAAQSVESQAANSPTVENLGYLVNESSLLGG